MFESIRENLIALLGLATAGSMAATARFWLELRQERRNTRESSRSEREAMAPHVERFWKAADAVCRDYTVRCSNRDSRSGMPSALAQELVDAERALVLRTTRKAVAEAVSAHAGAVRVLTLGRAGETGRPSLGGSEEWAGFLSSQARLRELVVSAE